MKLATTVHEYGPDIWLTKEQACKMLVAAGMYSRITMTMCRKHDILLGSSGHINKQSLEFYISLHKDDTKILDFSY